MPVLPGHSWGYHTVKFEGSNSSTRVWSPLQIWTDRHPPCAGLSSQWPPPHSTNTSRCFHSHPAGEQRARGWVPAIKSVCQKWHSQMTTLTFHWHELITGPHPTYKRAMVCNPLTCLQEEENQTFRKSSSTHLISKQFTQLSRPPGYYLTWVTKTVS